jgi:hypothetical protein
MIKIPSDSFQFKIAFKDGQKVVELNSRSFYQHFLNTKTGVGDIGVLHLKMKKPTRSEQQLRYYAIVVGLIADYTGNTWEEMHESLMILRFGTKEVKIGKDTVKVRRSVSNSAKFPKGEMCELIEFSIEKANELEIVIPTRESLGYLPN